jgi:uncharacterized protein involved in response to NO
MQKARARFIFVQPRDAHFARQFLVQFDATIDERDHVRFANAALAHKQQMVSILGGRTTSNLVHRRLEQRSTGHQDRFKIIGVRSLWGKLMQPRDCHFIPTP